LIAAHGDLLPKLDAPTLVPTSGKRFGKVDGRQLRASWDAARQEAVAESLMDWQVLGPFASGQKERVTLEQPTPLDEERAAAQGPDLSATYRANGKALRWKKATARKKDGQVDLTGELGPVEFCVGYGYTQVESIHPREAMIRCGSDDGIKVWVNGQIVHSNEVARGYLPGADQFPVHLKAGVNHILVKVDNYRFGWGFGLAVPKANF
jgi:hypothetical protein